MDKIVLIIYFALLKSTSTFDFNCELPIGCEINDINFHINFFSDEKTSIQIQGILCNVRDEKFHFNYSMTSPLIEPCLIYNETKKQTIEIRFHRDFIFGKWFNIKNMLNYGSLFKVSDTNFNFNFVNLKGFQLEIDENVISDYYFDFNCIKCNIAFYSNDRLIKSCRDITNTTRIISLFQLSYPDNTPSLSLFDPQFKTTICPLMFKNSALDTLKIVGLTDTFYKRNVLSFENFRDYLNSEILYLKIHAENINIDSSFLNPSVFAATSEIHLYGKVNRIDAISLGELELGRLRTIIFTKEHFRDMIHKSGIDWIRKLNANVNVNLDDLYNIGNHYVYRMKIYVHCTSYNPEIRLSKVFPDEDFCLYKDFPFKQYVILSEYVENYAISQLLIYSREYTCTYLWLAQYFGRFLSLKYR